MLSADYSSLNREQRRKFDALVNSLEEENARRAAENETPQAARTAPQSMLDAIEELRRQNEAQQSSTTDDRPWYRKLLG